MDQVAFVHDLRLHYQDEIVQVMQDLMRIPSQNMPPLGEERDCQEYIAFYLQRAGAIGRSIRTRPGARPGEASLLLAWPGVSQPAKPLLDPTRQGRRPLVVAHRSRRHRCSGRGCLDLSAFWRRDP